jgi:membrane-bound lytic murein transglycosylase D
LIRYDRPVLRFFERPERTRRPVALALALALAGGTGAARARAAPPPATSKRPTTASQPVEESLSQRRAVRGVSVDDVGSAETPELREIRRFEELAFPRAAAGRAASAGGDVQPAALPGNWPGSGDVTPDGRATAQVAPAAVSGAPDSDWLRALKLPDFPVRWDPQVLRYLDYFKNDSKGRSIMGNWLRRAGRYRDMFEKVLARQELPRDLVFLAMIESGFENTARSRVGAGGIWQFMPSAARVYGLEVSYWMDARRDPERSAEAAARYLKDLYVRFGSWHLVFAAYNAGYGAVLRAITNYNTNDYWELVKHESGLPWESSIYVPKIIAAAIVGRNQAAFGFADVTPEPGFAYEEIIAPAGTALSSVARAADAKPEAIEALNPQLVRSRTPPDRGATRVRVPAGSAAACAAALDKSHAGSEKLDTMVLRLGETLDDVARTRGVAVKELRRINGVKESIELRAGVAILVPPKRTAPDKAKDKDRDGDKTGDSDETILVAVPERSFSYEGRERVFYRTRDGDGLNEIADAFGVKPDELCEWNNLDPSAKLQARMVVQIFVRKDFDRAGVMLLDPTQVRAVSLGSEEFLELETARRGKKRLYYTAKTGDTLAKLGRRYGLTPGDLARINRFSYNTELHEGDRIVVYSPTAGVQRETSLGLTPGKKRPERTAADARLSDAQAKRKLPTPAPADAKKKPAAAPQNVAKSDSKKAGADKAAAKKK